MLIGKMCSREVICCDADTTALEAATLMRRAHVGDLVVVSENALGVRTPVGMVTDRDLVVEVMAQQVDPAGIKVGEFIGSDCLSVRDNATVFQAVEMMQKTGVRRLPVVDESNALVGIVASDDLMSLMGKQLSHLAQVGLRQRDYESRTRA